MTDRWFSFIVWLAFFGPMLTFFAIDGIRTYRLQRSRMTQLSNEWLYQHRGRANV